MIRKKIALIALVALFALSASACSGGSKDTNVPPTDTAAQTGTNAAASTGADEASKPEDGKPDETGIEVDKGLLNVEITLPASFFQGDPEQAIANAKANGVSEAVVNEDGSVTYKMSKATHEKMLKDMKDQAVQTIEEFVNDEELASIRDIEYNDKLSEYTVIVDRAAYENSFDGFIVLGLGMQGMFYQAFDGVPSEKQKVTINVKDQATGEIFHSVVFPDQINSQ
jgi:hypothetical protein